VKPDQARRQSARAGAVARWYAATLGARHDLIDGLQVCSGLPWWAYPRGGVTVGDTYLTGPEPGARAPARIRHENRHREQWERHGYRLALLYLLAGRSPHTNRFEVEADLLDGGYLEEPDPPES